MIELPAPQTDDRPYLAKNLAALYRLDVKLAVRIDRRAEAPLLPAEPTRSGHVTVKVPRDGEADLYLHSKYDPVAEARRLVDRLATDGLDSFPLLAVPFFVLAGNLMNAGGVTERIFAFARATFAPFRGGLAQVNVAASMPTMPDFPMTIPDIPDMPAFAIPGFGGQSNNSNQTKVENHAPSRPGLVPFVYE